MDELKKEFEEKKGKFAEILTRSFKDTKIDRALQILESAEIYYSRKIQDLEIKLKQLKRDRDSLMDISPTTAGSMITASDFQHEEFVEKDIAYGIQIRELEIKLDIAKKRYNYIFKGITEEVK